MNFLALSILAIFIIGVPLIAVVVWPYVIVRGVYRLLKGQADDVGGQCSCQRCVSSRSPDFCNRHDR